MMSPSISVINHRVPNPPWIHTINSITSPLHLLPLTRTRNLCLTRARSYAPLRDDSSSPSPAQQHQFGYDPAQELFGLDTDIAPRDVAPGAREPRSWFGPNGQYIRELPCPSCRGRGYTPCTKCRIEKPKIDCSQCNGKGMMSCSRCLGECVIWEEFIDERPWENARSSSPVKVKDDELDNLDVKLDVKRKSNRVYHPLSAEHRLNISRSLKSLNATTGLFSKRMKLIHSDPVLRAQRVAAIKKAKNTPESRKRNSEATRAFFSDPENRRKLSIIMKQVKFYCQNCGQEGHRRNFCPQLEKVVSNRCTICREEGHNKRVCPRLRPIQRTKQLSRCKTCRQPGHSCRTCPLRSGNALEGALKLDLIGKVPRRPYQCKVCGQVGHNSRSCPHGDHCSSEGREMGRNRRRGLQCG
ncbi:hypothetical protein Drorol1_Dr00008226 [Drosera rotundifolia]